MTDIATWAHDGMSARDQAFPIETNGKQPVATGGMRDTANAVARDFRSHL